MIKLINKKIKYTTKTFYNGFHRFTSQILCSIRRFGLKSLNTWACTDKYATSIIDRSCFVIYKTQDSHARKLSCNTPLSLLKDWFVLKILLTFKTNDIIYNSIILYLFYYSNINKKNICLRLPLFYFIWSQY